MFSNVDIEKEIAIGHLSIQDFNPECMRPSSYLLRLDKVILSMQEGIEEIDTKKTDTAEYFNEHVMTEDGFLLEPGGFYLGSSIEKISLPKSICADMFQLSCYARVGLSINFSSNLVAASFGISKPSSLTFEIKNESSRSIRIYPFVKFCHIRFHYHNSESTQVYRGIYSGQTQAKAANFNAKPAR
jgi:dCTP deaminase